jgi:hypothetical protein
MWEDSLVGSYSLWEELSVVLKVLESVGAFVERRKKLAEE